MLKLGRIVAALLAVGSLVWVATAQAPARDDEPLSAEQQARLPERHPDADADGDGTVTRSEAREALRRQAGSDRRPGPPPGDRPGADRGRLGRPDPARLLERYPELDTNRDGVLSDDELRAARGRLGRPEVETFRPSPRFFDWLLERFKEADLDGNGQLSREEVTKLRDRYAGPPTTRPADGEGARTGSQVLNRFPEADADGDGQVTPEEFRAYRTQNPGDARQTLLQRYPEADTDGDGKVSDEEFNALRERLRSRLDERTGRRPERTGSQQSQP